MNLVFASDNGFWISWKYGAEENVPSLRLTNDVIGSYITASARIHLYRYIARLRENAIYCVMDTVIYIQPRDETQHIQTCDILDDMTFELRRTQMIKTLNSSIRSVV